MSPLHTSDWSVHHQYCVWVPYTIQHIWKDICRSSRNGGVSITLLFESGSSLISVANSSIHLVNHCWADLFSNEIHLESLLFLFFGDIPLKKSTSHGTKLQSQVDQVAQGTSTSLALIQSELHNEKFVRKQT